jgi:hypothetical protein
MNDDAHDTHDAHDGSSGRGTPASATIPVSIPAGLPAAAALHRRSLTATHTLDLLVVPAEASSQNGGIALDGAIDDVAAIIRTWVGAAETSAPAVIIPLYDCLVAWAPERAAVVGPPERLASLETAVVEFAMREAELRSGEQQATVLLDAIEGDLAVDDEMHGRSRQERLAVTQRYRAAVTIGRQLSLLAPAVHAPPVHPATLASQLGERLRERTRLVERHELATARGELVERLAEASRQRTLEVSVARQQTGLEWTIVVLLVVQTALLMVDLLAQRGTQ